MYEYIKGTVTAADPAHVVIESGGMGYHILITLQTYEILHGQKEAHLWLHLLVRDDAHLLYGFATRDERRCSACSTAYRVSALTLPAWSFLPW